MKNGCHVISLYGKKKKWLRFTQNASVEQPLDVGPHVRFHTRCSESGLQHPAN